MANNNHMPITIVSLFCAILVIVFACLMGGNKKADSNVQRQIAFLGEDEEQWRGPTQPLDQIIALAVADPELDAKAAFTRSDLRFIGVLAHTVIVPPWDIKIDNVRLIAFTGDVHRSNESEKLAWLAENYAKKYNLALQKLLVNK
ncbi:MAG TPA: hypothetical protein DCP71_08205 [Verrucomicrobiales bacterium]|nr:hypothetical protein [Verrucomicrobiales bacterium]